MRLRALLLLGVAAATVAGDLIVEAAVRTSASDYHHRSHAWAVLALAFLAGLLALVVLPSRTVAILTGLAAGGTAGNLASARLNGGSVANPLVAHEIAFNVADVALLLALPLVMVAAARVAIVHRAAIDRLVPPHRWELALRRRLGL